MVDELRGFVIGEFVFMSVKSIFLGIFLLILHAAGAVPMGRRHQEWMEKPNNTSTLREISQTTLFLVDKALKTRAQRRELYISNGIFNSTRSEEDPTYADRFWEQARLTPEEIEEDLLFMRARAGVVFGALASTGLIHGDFDFPALLQRIDDTIPLIKSE